MAKTRFCKKVHFDGTFAQLFMFNDFSTPQIRRDETRNGLEGIVQLIK